MDYSDYLVYEAINQGKDMSLSIDNPDYSNYASPILSDWAIKRINNLRVIMKNITNWKNEMIIREDSKYRSPYELETVYELERFNISYFYEDRVFPYYYEGKIHMDVTDFYIPAAKLVLEIKDRNFRKYINYKPNLSEKIIAMRNAVEKAGYNFGLIDSVSSLKYLFLNYDLIESREEYFDEYYF